MCPVALALASGLRAAPEPPRAPWCQLPHPGLGQLRGRHVPRGSSSRHQAPHLRMVVWAHKFRLHLREKYDGTVNSVEFL
jgi:hypothetical protein